MYELKTINKLNRKVIIKKITTVKCPNAGAINCSNRLCPFFYETEMTDLCMINRKMHGKKVEITIEEK